MKKNTIIMKFCEKIPNKAKVKLNKISLRNKVKEPCESVQSLHKIF